MPGFFFVFFFNRNHFQYNLISPRCWSVVPYVKKNGWITWVLQFLTCLKLTIYWAQTLALVFWLVDLTVGIISTINFFRLFTTKWYKCCRFTCPTYKLFLWNALITASGILNSDAYQVLPCLTTYINIFNKLHCLI